MIEEKVRILEHESLTDKYFLLTLKSRYISENAIPGQFVNIRVRDSISPLLRRPISIHQVNSKEKTFKLLYEVIGSGTETLSKHKPGDEVDVLGPLGKGFSFEGDNAILVAGGMGIAPLAFLAWELLNNNKKVSIFIGTKTKNFTICEGALKNAGAEVHFATEDGSYGNKGLVTDILSSRITHYSLLVTHIYSCGPKVMLKEVAKIAKKNNLPCQVSMEAYMACGIGACYGCALESRSGYKMCCKDGPVFNAEEIKW